MIKGINAWTFERQVAIADAARQARSAGFEAFEPVLEMSGELTPATDEASCRRLGEVIREAGLRIPALACGLFWEASLTSPDAKVRKRAYELALAALDRTAWLNAGILIAIPGVVARSETKKLECRYADALAYASLAFRDLALEAEIRGVAIALENVWSDFLVSPVEMREFIDHINSPWVGVCFNVGNAMRYGVPQDWIATLGRRILRVHLKDYKLGDAGQGGLCPLGEGDVDWAAVMAGLGEIRYDEPLIYDGAGELKDISDRMDRLI